MAIFDHNSSYSGYAVGDTFTSTIYWATNTFDGVALDPDCLPGLVTPIVASVTPNTSSTSGGAAIVITGNNFTGATSVLFGSNAAASFNVVNDSTINAVVPAAAAGPTLITLTIALGTSAPGGKFTYIDDVAPVLSIVQRNCSRIYQED